MAKVPAVRRAYLKAYREAHIEKFREREARYRAAHREEARALSAKWLEAHREEKRAYNARYTAAWRLANPEKARANDAKQTARRRGARLCEHQSCLSLGADFLAWQVSEHKCYLCGVPVWQGVNLHMDHLTPVSRGGIHCAENLRPSCATCNLSKSAMTVEEYSARQVMQIG